MRRSWAEFEWLAKHLEETTGFKLSPPLPKQEKGVDALSLFLTEIARDDQYQTVDELITFLFQEEPIVTEGRPETFSCALGGAEGLDRSELAALPESYLKIIAAHIHASIRNCVTPFEFADRILARAAGLNEEEAVPIAERDTSGQGFKALKDVEEDLFDSLASNRVAHSQDKQVAKAAATGDSASARPSVASAGQSSVAVASTASSSVANGSGRTATSAGVTGSQSSSRAAEATPWPTDANAKTPMPAAGSSASVADITPTPATAATAVAANGGAMPSTAPTSATTGKSSVFTPRTSTSTLSADSRVTRIPVTVPAFLKQLGVDQHAPTFVDAGYDDMRVVAALQAHELEPLGLNSDELEKVMRGALEWQLNANEAGILDNWARAQVRAGPTGVLEVRCRKGWGTRGRGEGGRKNDVGLSLRAKN